MSNDKIAVCNCGSPLISTFAFSGAEYYCLDCGRKYGMLGVDRVAATPEIKQELDDNEKTFSEIREGLLSGGAMLKDCNTCSQTGQSHLHHATPKEVKAHEAALKRLKELATKSTPPPEQGGSDE